MRTVEFTMIIMNTNVFFSTNKKYGHKSRTVPLNSVFLIAEMNEFELHLVRRGNVLMKLQTAPCRSAIQHPDHLFVYVWVLGACFFEHTDSTVCCFWSCCVDVVMSLYPSLVFSTGVSLTIVPVVSSGCPVAGPWLFSCRGHISCQVSDG